MNLKIEEVTKKYGEKQALKCLNLELESGIIGLLGPNGAGKSTLMRIISTIEQPTFGKITFDGIDVAENPNELRGRLGYLPQDFGVYENMTAIEFLEYMAVMKGLSIKSARNRISDLIEALNLNNHTKKLLGGFSGGMKQRVGIAQALLNDPDLIIVDEPTVGLDPEERIRFRNLLSSLSSEKIVILSTHIVSDIESIANKIAILAQGDLCEYTTPELLIKNVNGKVWNAIIEASEYENINKKYQISTALHGKDTIQARIISDNQPTLNATNIVPSLEDAYLYYIESRGGIR